MKLKNFIRTTIRNILSENEDNYASFKDKKPYHQRKNELIDSIKSFNDIDDNKIREIFEFFGTEGYNDEEEAFDDFKNKIDEWASFPDPVKLYRIVGVKDKKLLKKDELGEHWTPYEWNLNGDLLMSIGYELWNEYTKPYIIEALVPLSEIDIIQTIFQNLSFPNENEINIKNKGKNIKFIKSYRLKDM